jgi:hypothetical protein
VPDVPGLPSAEELAALPHEEDAVAQEIESGAPEHQPLIIFVLLLTPSVRPL